MSDIIQGLIQAIRLLLGDAGTWAIVRLSRGDSGAALLISGMLGVPLGGLLGLWSFPGRRLVVALVYTGMGFPPVVVGLLVYLLLSRAGPLGFLDWLFTPRAMILAQALISMPLIVGLTMSAVQAVDAGLRRQLHALGATEIQSGLTLLWEARAGVIVAVVAGFGRMIAEVGAVMLVGGNIEGSTRVLTTAIVLETRTGAFDAALALAFVLLAVSFAINAVMLRLQGRLVAS